MKAPGWLTIEIGPNAHNESCEATPHAHFLVGLKRWYWLRPSFWGYVLRHRAAVERDRP